MRDALHGVPHVTGDLVILGAQSGQPQRQLHRHLRDEEPPLGRPPGPRHLLGRRQQGRRVCPDRPDLRGDSSIVGESNGSLYTLEHQWRVLVANVGTCAVTGNSTCLITFKSKRREALDMNLSESKRAVRLFDAAVRVYVSVLLLLFQGLRSTLKKKADKSRKGPVVLSTQWYIDQAAYLMMLENLVQTFLGLKKVTEDVFSSGPNRASLRSMTTLPVDLP